MSDFFFLEEWTIQDYDDPLFGAINPATLQSSFVPYTSGSEPFTKKDGRESSCAGNSNIHRRVIEFLKTSWGGGGLGQVKNKRGHRHMISERCRRERERKGYIALHSLLPPGTKNDKFSIVQMAASRIEETRRYKDVLESRNKELERELASMGSAVAGSKKISLTVANPAVSGVDSMVQALKYLKSSGSKATSVHSKLTDQEVAATIHVDSEIDAAEVENTLRRTLQSS